MIRLALAMLQGRVSGAADTIRDAATRPDVSPLDSVSLEQPPLPGGVAAIFRWFFHVPQWIQIGGAILAVLVITALLIVVWRRRARMREWLVTRSRGAKIALATAAAIVLLTAAGFGAASWNYMMHDNDFCSGCHVMAPSFGRFQTSEHKKLNCHDCHQQSIFASTRQLYLWVLDRPEEIGAHAKVPTRVCAECHIQEQPDSVWQRISATAGHRIHLESDSASLRDVQCVTCHGVAVHEFAPADSTCGQSECHARTEIRLAGMRNQTALHCTLCHQFTAPVSEQTTLDTSRALLVPREVECLGCHEMRERLADFDPDAEPHQAVCGTCHDPHRQETPAAAFETCATSGCHARPDTITPFHRGLRAGVLDDCAQCHKAHTWHVESKQCLTCHQGILQDRPQTRARASADARHASPHESAMSGFVRFAQSVQQAPAVAASLDISHRQHRELECTTCHRSGRTHGELLIRSERDCQSCHHSPERTTTCAQCHQTAELRATHRIPVRFTVPEGQDAETRDVAFQHSQHSDVACGTCHATPVTLAVSRDCASCHSDHHAAEAECRLCHRPAKADHTRQAHLGCAGSGCHTMRQPVALQETRNVCLTCHGDMVNHRPGRECAACHEVRWLAERRPGA
jgi:class III cytochrome C family protein